MARVIKHSNGVESVLIPEGEDYVFNFVEKYGAGLKAATLHFTPETTDGDVSIAMNPGGSDASNESESLFFRIPANSSYVVELDYTPFNTSLDKIAVYASSPVYISIQIKSFGSKATSRPIVYEGKEME